MAEIKPARVLRLAVGELEANCYILWDPKSREAFVIDPGGDADVIKEAVKKEGIRVKYIINTHGHFDHVGADSELKSSFKSPIAIHKKDTGLLADSHEHGKFFGIKTPRQRGADILLEDGDTLAAGSVTLEVLHTPGHTQGCICLYSKKDGLLFTGDTLFAGSVGRTDFEGGSMEDLLDSIKRKILPLGDSVRVLPGHGSPSTIGDEKKSNPFITGAFSEG